MEHEPGDDYIRKTASFIRDNERRLADSGLGRRKPTSAASAFNPLSWVGLGDGQAAQGQLPLVLSVDTHHLFYILMRLEALGLDIGSLDVRVDEPSRPLSYITIPDKDNSDSRSISSFRSTMSAVSKLSLGMGWWGRPETRSVDAELKLKYIYSSFTKLPALSVHAPGPMVIAELAQDPPGNSAIPLDSFKNLRSLECLDTDPRALLGWDRLAESLRSLTIKRSGIDDPTSIFVDAVLDDQLRREGDASRARTRRLGHYSPKGGRTPVVPETVHEEAEEQAPTPGEEPPSSPSSPLPAQLPSWKWAFLRHLSLADNALTSIPSSLFSLLTSVTHLDLSSNLLVSIPSGLSSLYNLVSLSLADNMIDSVLGIYTKLGQVLTLNLSRNRIESLCGLERLVALERIDLRHNLLDESAEVGRLAVLPHVSEVWIEHNPFVTLEENYRVRCFDYFWREGKQIALDGSPPGFYERRSLTALPKEESRPIRPPPAAYSPPIVPVGGAPVHGSPPLASSPSVASTSMPSPGLSAVTPKVKKRRNKRIVDLDGDSDYRSSEDGGRRTQSHSRNASEVTPKQEPPKDEMPTAPVTVQFHAGPSSMEVHPPTPTERPSKSRHSRYHTEYAPSSPSTELPPSGSDTSSANGRQRSGTLSSLSAKRRQRISASLYEPGGEPSRNAADAAASQLREADAFRAKIEALRSEMGDNWLQVLAQSQFIPAAEPVKRG